jgi:hypothetical protein
MIYNIQCSISIYQISKTLLLLVVFICFSSCSNNHDSPKVTFYYWKTEFKLSQSEKEVLKSNNVETLYIRYFDIGLKDNTPIPIAPIHFIQKPEMHIVPVVYIKNEVLVSSVNVQKLSQDIIKLIQDISNYHQLTYQEIQLDCDWTLESKFNYFKLINLCKKLSNKIISSTIRLHQVKFSSRTGIPNVDKGVLMYYNMGKIHADTLNSIYQRDIAKRYIKTLSQYPLELNIALPIYSWGIHIRNNRVIGLINKIKKKSFITDTNFTLIQHNILLTKNSILKSGFFFKKGDRIKIESISKLDIETMIGDLSDHVKTPPKEIIFFDLDDNNVDGYNYGPVFQKMCNSF